MLSNIPPNLRQGIRFLVVGGLGTVSGSVLIHLFHEQLHWQIDLSFIVSFFFAVTQNFLLHFYWSFRENQVQKKISWLKYFSFIATSLGALVVNWSVLRLLDHYFTWPTIVIPNALGILAGMVVNYFSARFLIFRKKSTAEQE